MKEDMNLINKVMGLHWPLRQAIEDAKLDAGARDDVMHIRRILAGYVKEIDSLPKKGAPQPTERRLFARSSFLEGSRVSFIDRDRA